MYRYYKTRGKVVQIDDTRIQNLLDELVGGGARPPLRMMHRHLQIMPLPRERYSRLAGNLKFVARTKQLPGSSAYGEVQPVSALHVQATNGCPGSPDKRVIVYTGFNVLINPKNPT